ncbi:MAG: PIN domain nuclease [Actinobacteria bacterium]|nr:PIN domain nuclease [Actinomycetota bacterium]
MDATFLADTSAWARCSLEPVEAVWIERVDGDMIAICSPVRLELGVSARSRSDWEMLMDEMDSMPSVTLDPPVCRRSEEVQGLLASTGQHRGPRPMDLLIAAIAEAHDLTLLHYDRHFDLIAEVTGQPMEWLAPRGTLD